MDFYASYFPTQPNWKAISDRLAEWDEAALNYEDEILASPACQRGMRRVEESFRIKMAESRSTGPHYSIVNPYQYPEDETAYEESHWRTKQQGSGEPQMIKQKYELTPFGPIDEWGFQHAVYHPVGQPPEAEDLCTQRWKNEPGFEPLFGAEPYMEEEAPVYSRSVELSQFKPWSPGDFDEVGEGNDTPLPSFWDRAEGPDSATEYPNEHAPKIGWQDMVERIGRCDTPPFDCGWDMEAIMNRTYADSNASRQISVVPESRPPSRARSEPPATAFHFDARPPSPTSFSEGYAAPEESQFDHQDVIDIKAFAEAVKTKKASAKNNRNQDRNVKGPKRTLSPASSTRSTRSHVRASASPTPFYELDAKCRGQEVHFTDSMGQNWEPEIYEAKYDSDSERKGRGSKSVLGTKGAKVGKVYGSGKTARVV